MRKKNSTKPKTWKKENETQYAVSNNNNNNNNSNNNNNNNPLLPVKQKHGKEDERTLFRCFFFLFTARMSPSSESMKSIRSTLAPFLSVLPSFFYWVSRSQQCRPIRGGLSMVSLLKIILKKSRPTHTRTYLAGTNPIINRFFSVYFQKPIKSEIGFDRSIDFVISLI